MSKMDTRMDVQESTLKQLGQAVQQSQVAIQILEVQVGQLARSSQSRAQGALPSNIETNLKEHCMALTLRSGKQVDQPVGVQEKEKEMSNVKPHGDNSFSTKDKEEEKEKEINKEDNLAETSFDLPPSPEVMAYVPPILYPQRLKKYKDEKSFKKFLEVFKKLHINIPFAKTLAPMPTYVKFLKEIISNKRRFEDFETVTLTEECSAIILNKLSPKLKDPGSFTIPCTIGNTKFGNALCDLGASINLMPFSVFSGQQEKKSSVEDLIFTFMLKQDELMSKMDTRMDVQESTLKQFGQAVQQSQVAIQILEVQVGQLARSSQSRAQGALPSNIETNLKEHCMALTLRSGKQVDQPVGVQEKEKEMSNVKPHGDNSFSTKDKEEEKEKEINKEDNLTETSFDLPPSPEVMAYVPPIPYPQRLKKYKDEKSFKKFLEVFKKLHINIPFAKALAPMPTYVKFLKEIISNKRRFEDFETVTLTEECSAIILNKLSPKLKDPGSFTIPCTIGNTKFGNALCDLGASINLMPFSVFKKLGWGKVKSTNGTLQLADRSVKYLHGIVEDVLVKVDELYFLVDFVVLEMEEDVEIPLILGRPFLATSRVLIDVHEGKLTLRVGDEEAIFNVFKARKIHASANTCFMVDLSNPTEVKEFKRRNQDESLDKCIVNKPIEKHGDIKVKIGAPQSDSSHRKPKKRRKRSRVHVVQEKLKEGETTIVKETNIECNSKRAISFWRVRKDYRKLNPP
ncbi:hypothetical protein ACOSQ3_019455 [Xanthoceras sorbifolium]